MFRQFFDELLNGKLIGLKCKKCGYITCPPKSTCDNCGSRELEKIQLSGKGKIISYTTTYIAPIGYEREVPYVVAIVELDEGPWIIGRVDINAEDAEIEDLIGKRVEIFAKEFPPDQFYVDKQRRVVMMFRIVE